MQTWTNITTARPIPGPVLAFTPQLSNQQSIMDRKKILVVDDSPLILRALSMKLKSCGYDAITATDGSSAVSAVRHEHPDLILLDISFPPDVGHGGGVAWDGFLIMTWLRRIDEAKDIPIIIITGDEKMKERAMKEGAVAFFHKPIDNDELISVIQNQIGEGAAVDPTPPPPPVMPPPVPRTPPS
jgi:CheY-like chemotaxis protein